MVQKIRSYQDLVAWQKAMDLVTEIYRLSQKFPKEELFGLASQIRRAAVSIPSNIAEGRGKASKGEVQQFLGHAKGSLFEVETQILIARNLNYLNESEANRILEQTAEVGKVLNGLIASFKKLNK